MPFRLTCSRMLLLAHADGGSTVLCSVVMLGKVDTESHPKRQQSSVIAENVQGDLGGKGNIVGGDSIGHCEKNSLYERVSNSEWALRWCCLNLCV